METPLTAITDVRDECRGPAVDRRAAHIDVPPVVRWEEGQRPGQGPALHRSKARGPGWQRALSTGYDAAPKRLTEPGRSAASFAAKPRGDIAIGQRVFHDKFGYGEVVDQEGNKLEIEFEASGRKRVIDSFVKPAE